MADASDDEDLALFQNLDTHLEQALAKPNDRSLDELPPDAPPAAKKRAAADAVEASLDDAEFSVTEPTKCEVVLHPSPAFAAMPVDAPWPLAAARIATLEPLLRSVFASYSANEVALCVALRTLLCGTPGAWVSHAALAGYSVHDASALLAVAAHCPDESTARAAADALAAVTSRRAATDGEALSPRQLLATLRECGYCESGAGAALPCPGRPLGSRVHELLRIVVAAAARESPLRAGWQKSERDVAALLVALARCLTDPLGDQLLTALRSAVSAVLLQALPPSGGAGGALLDRLVPLVAAELGSVPAKAPAEVTTPRVEMIRRLPCLTRHEHKLRNATALALLHSLAEPGHDVPVTSEVAAPVKALYAAARAAGAAVALNNEDEKLKREAHAAYWRLLLGYRLATSVLTHLSPGDVDAARQSAESTLTGVVEDMKKYRRTTYIVSVLDEMRTLCATLYEY